MPPVPDDGPTTPGWVVAPDASKSPDVFTAAQGMGVRVEPDVLKTFAQQTGAQAMAFNGSVQNGIQSMLPLASGIGAGTEASGQLSKVHGERMQQLMAFVQDVGVGLAAFSSASSTIAINYVDSDSTQSATMQQVQGAFAPPPGSASIRQSMDEAAARQEQATAADQAVVDDMVSTLQLPEPTDLTPDQDAPAQEADERAGGQQVELGDSGDTYTVPRTYDLEGGDANAALQQIGSDAQEGDEYTPPQAEAE